MLFQHAEVTKESFTGTEETWQKDKASHEKIILKLRGQIKDLERVDLERQDLEEKAKALEKDLKISVSESDPLLIWPIKLITTIVKHQAKAVLVHCAFLATKFQMLHVLSVPT